MASGEEDGSLSVYEMANLAKAFEEHRPRLLAMLQSRLDPAMTARVDAEDLLHEAFFLANRRWRSFPSTGMTLYAWLYRIARDCLIEIWRRQNCEGRDPRREVPWPERSSCQQFLRLIGSQTSPSEALARRELGECIQLALAQLRPGDREILQMRHFDQLPFHEAAMVLEISENTAIQRYVRALRRLKQLLPDLYPSGDRGP